MSDKYDIGLYDYELPEGLIAREPASPRDSSRLLVLERTTEKLIDSVFRELPSFLQNDDLLVVNDTRVFPARLLGKKTTGGKAEVFLLEPIEGGFWEALVRPGKRLCKGDIVEIADDLSVEIIGRLGDGSRKIRLIHNGDLWEMLEKVGHTPLPFYIDRPDRPEDTERYQTVYANSRGAVAAPTAGLHFTENLIEKLDKKGVDIVRLTLHIGWGTFKGIEAADIRAHSMHSEYYEIPDKTAQAVNEAKAVGRRVIAVGTSTIRALESAALKDMPLKAHSARTELFIMPGFEFKTTDGAITNFHLPKSSLIVMISALTGRETILAAYKHAIDKKYRFYSYGDAMLIL